MGSKRTPMTLMMVLTLVCAILPALGAVLPPSAFAQQEYTSLGEEEGLVSGILSDVLEDGGDQEEENDGDAEDKFNQDATVTATIDPNQGQDVDEDNVGEFGDDNADADDANVAAPIATPIDVEEDEEPQNNNAS